ADGFGERLAGDIDRALPARLQLGSARQHMAVERELLVDEGLGQIRRRPLERMKREVLLPGCKRLAGSERREPGECSGRPHYETRMAIQSRCAEIRLPV